MIKKISMFLLLFLLYEGIANAEKVLKVQEIIVPQKDVPIVISSYNVFFQSKEGYRDQGFIEKMTLKNITDKEIIGVRFHYIHYNIFNEPIFNNKGIYIETINPGMEYSAQWQEKAEKGLDLLTSIVYVEKIRFKDGTIWVADRNEVELVLKKNNLSFTFDNE